MKKQNTSFWKTRGQQLLSAVVLMFLAWLLFLRVTHTGSLQQWGLLILIIGFAINRLYVGIRPRAWSSKH